MRRRHEMLPGTAAEPAELTEADGARVGEFLRALHDLPLADLGLTVAPDGQFPPTVARMEREVLPLLESADRLAGAALLERVRRVTPMVLAHRDLGPEHLLVDGGRVSGVIDWTDAGLDDPAMDLAWVVHGTPPRFRDSLIRVYAPAPTSLNVRSTGTGWGRGTRCCGVSTKAAPHPSGPGCGASTADCERGSRTSPRLDRPARRIVEHVWNSADG